MAIIGRFAPTKFFLYTISMPNLVFSTFGHHFFCLHHVHVAKKLCLAAIALVKTWGYCCLFSWLASAQFMGI